MTLLFVCVAGYIALLVIDVIDDEMLVRDSHFRSEQLPMPDLVFGYKTPFNISCYFTYNDNSVNDQKCNQYVRQPTLHEGLFVGLFNAGSDVNVSRADGNGILGVSFNISISNTSLDTTIMTLSAFDQEFNPLASGEDNSANMEYPDFAETLIYRNSYQMAFNQSYMLLFSRRIKEPIKHRAASVFGISSHDQIPYLSSILESASLQGIGNNSTQIRLSVSPQTFFVEVETETRSSTVLTAFALLGGIWCLFLTVYTVLFGMTSVRPWGCVQSYCCCFAYQTKAKLREIYPVPPLIDTPGFPYATEQGSLSQVVVQLQRRHEVLEMFIREYVVDVRHLRDLNNVASLDPSPSTSVVDASIHGTDEDGDPTSPTYVPPISESSSNQQQSPEINVMRHSQVTQAAFVQSNQT